ncbi:MAG: hypothetical protein HDR88_13860 [Bacteroides sp.]|nr:hypothetical protein [Bacteroides sp.]
MNFASADANLFASLFKHTFSQGWIEGLQGGNVLHGFLSGAVAKLGGNLIDTHCRKIGVVGMVIANSMLTGTVDEIGGGKFANGAITGAFSYLFNETLHRTPPQEETSSSELWATAGAIALTASAIDGPLPVGDIIGAGVMAGALIYDLTHRIYLTYVLINHETKQYYIGRTSGVGTPYQVFMRRYCNHHMRGFGFVPYKIDKFKPGIQGYRAIRGREQQLIDFYGGIGDPKVANSIRGVAERNRRGRRYHMLSNRYFGNIAPYTGK